MKPLYSTPIAFKPMKEPTANCPWCEGKGYEWVECGELSGYDYREPCRCVLRRIPYLVGEKCYVREAWRPECPTKGTYKGFLGTGYKDGTFRLTGWPNGFEAYPNGKWRSPVTMPQWAARRFVAILSCVPMRVNEICVADLQELGYFASLMQDPCDMADQIKDKFKADWHKRHPGKEWVWRVESEEGK